ncbi:GNAT family N-acetyltransferase [Sphaerisporangium corydalis]|uniref:GNAT family N-acetyltransferase n=1 Tax=Sphaerisporangium corydalis TaxID=1441875 RepID=A0ABV9EPV9_9ACTN|nr:GNAT family N-acetyltransferase [Sphaerisporangium corydalis]
MTRTEPFTPDHIGGAAELLAARHLRDLGLEPALDGRYTEPGECRAVLERAWRAGARGQVAYEGGAVAAYLLAEPGDGVRGRHRWTGPEHAAYAASSGFAALGRLYADLSGSWLADARPHHYVVTPAADLAPWLTLGFAHEQIHALTTTPPAPPPPAGPPLATSSAAPSSAGLSSAGLSSAGLSSAGLSPLGPSPLGPPASGPSSDGPPPGVRRAGPGDIDALEPILGLIFDAHAAPPVFAYIDGPMRDNLRPGHLELLNDPAVSYWVSESGQGVDGFCVMRPVPPDEATLLAPRGSVELILAATAKHARGTGVGRRLAEHALAAAARQGFPVCVTDWRAANPASSVFWPHRGFRPIAYRLHRLLDPRLTVLDHAPPGG